MAILFDSRLNTGSAWTRSGGSYSNGVDILAINQDVTRYDAFTQVIDDEFGLVWEINAIPQDLVADKIRDELSPPNSGVNDAGPPRDNSGTYMAKLTNLWYRWAIRLDPDWWFATNATKNSGDCVLLQCHDAPGTSSRVAPLHMILVNDVLELRNSYSETVDYDRLLWRDKAVTGQWYTFVLNAYLDDAAPATGYLRWWVNERKLFTEDNGLNTYATFNSPGPWPKMGGIYYPHGMPRGFPGNKIRNEGMIVGDGYSSFDEFMIAAGLSDRELEMPASSCLMGID